MGIVKDIKAKESDVREAVNRVVLAEQEDEEKHDSGPNQNSHFEFRCGDQRDKEVYVYVERLDHTEGIEVMVWADESYFEECEADRPDIADGGEELEDFVDTLFGFVTDELEGEHYVNVEFYSNASPSVVFADTFYL